MAPYRVRRINWNLLVNPTMQGINIRARGDENFARGIGRGLSDLGTGIQNQRLEKESNRRARSREGLAQGSLDLRRDELNLKRNLDAADRSEAAANQAYLDGLVNELSQSAVTESQQTGEVSPQTKTNLTKVVEGQGGPEIVKKRQEALAEIECDGDG